MKDILLKITLFFTLCALVSCSESDKVRTIDVKIDSEMAAVKKEVQVKGLPEGANLILGLIIPTTSSQWFVKLSGPSSEFNEVKELLDKLISTIDFDDYSVEVVKLELPDGWIQKREKGFLHSSITKEGIKSRVTISKASGSVLDNVNRWNRQLGNGPMDERQLMQVSQKQVVNGRFGIIVVLAKHDGSTRKELQGSAAPQAPVAPANPHGGDATMNTARGIRVAFADVNGLTWYIKFMGSADVLIREKTNFETFVKSFSYEDKTAKWTVPTSWKTLGGGGMIKASFDANGAKVTVITLPVGGGTLEGNVNRWRRQIGLESQSLAEINKQLQSLDAGSVKYKYLFISTAAIKTASTTPVAAPVEAAPTGGKATQSGISFTLPAGWKTVPASGMRQVNLLIGDIQVTGISLGAGAKGLKKNVDRWCGQVGVENFTAEQLAKYTEKVDFSGGKADLVTIEGKEKSILALVYDEEESVWFFKAMGASAVLMKEKENFATFVKSIKLAEGDK
jgi:hypothetical protein